MLSASEPVGTERYTNFNIIIIIIIYRYIEGVYRCIKVCTGCIQVYTCIYTYIQVYTGIYRVFTVTYRVYTGRFQLHTGCIQVYMGNTQGVARRYIHVCELMPTYVLYLLHSKQHVHVPSYTVRGYMTTCIHDWLYMWLLAPPDTFSCLSVS